MSPPLSAAGPKPIARWTTDNTTTRVRQLVGELAGHRQQRGRVVTQDSAARLTGNDVAVAAEGDVDAAIGLQQSRDAAADTARRNVHCVPSDSVSENWMSAERTTSRPVLNETACRRKTSAASAEAVAHEVHYARGAVDDRRAQDAHHRENIVVVVLQSVGNGKSELRMPQHRAAHGVDRRRCC